MPDLAINTYRSSIPLDNMTVSIYMAEASLNTKSLSL